MIIIIISTGNLRLFSFKICQTEDTHMSKLYTITLNGVTEEVYNKATDYIEKHALRLNYRPEVSTIDAEFPDDIDPAKSPELQEAYIRNVQQRL